MVAREAPDANHPAPLMVVARSVSIRIKMKMRSTSGCAEESQ